MLKHSYIDESGTKDHQEITTVALLLLDGAFSAQRLHKQIIKALFPQSTKPGRKNDKMSFQLHYSDMTHDQKLTVAEILSKQSIECYTSCFYHDGSEKLHEQRFEIYSSLIRLCLHDALQIHEHLDVIIAQQSNWQTYRGPLLVTLDEIVAENSARLGFRKAKFAFESAAKPGVQLADFYAGATRGNLLNFRDASLGAPFDLIQGQIREIRVHGEINSKAKG